MKKLLIFSMLCFVSKISFSQQNKLSGHTDSLKFCCVVTGINIQKKIVTINSNYEGVENKFRVPSDIILIVKTGDSLFVNALDNKSNHTYLYVKQRANGKVVGTMKFAKLKESGYNKIYN